MSAPEFNLTASVDARKLREAISRYIATFRLEAGDVIRDQARLFFSAAIRLLPPRNKKQGDAAVQRDIHRAVLPANPDAWKHPRIRRLIEERDAEGLESVLKHIDARWRVTPFDASLHRRARRSRGRVDKPQFLTTLDRDAVAGRVDKMQARVGMMKAAWLPALRAVGGKAPQWIARHARPFGSVSTTLGATDPEIRATNAARGVSLFARVTQAALRQRTRAILNDLRHRLNKTGKYAGLS